MSAVDSQKVILFEKVVRLVILFFDTLSDAGHLKAFFFLYVICDCF